MLSTLKVVKALIFAAIIIYLIYLFNTFNVIETERYNSSFSQFISLKGTDEFVISVLDTTEINETDWVKKILGIPFASVDAEIKLVASYKYYIKLSELKYSIEDDTIVFNVPSLYLSTPVAFDSSTLQRKCDSDGFATCKGSLNNLTKEITGKLEVKGNAHMSTMYDKSAKTLADNFNSFAKQNNDVDYNNIAVVFANEPSQSRHIFNYNKNDCGNEPCSLPVPISSNGFLLTQ